MPGLTGLHQNNSMQPADSQRVVHVTDDYTVKGFEAAIVAIPTGAMTLTFPVASEMPGQTVCVHLKASQTLTISFANTPISPTFSAFATSGDWALLYSDGYGWYCLREGALSTEAVTVA